jgi:antitoxin VapB
MTADKRDKTHPLMVRLPFSEAVLLEGIDAYLAHADELAKPQSHELDPLERLRESVKKYERPTDPVCEEYFEGDGVSEDFMADRDQSLKKKK